MTGGKTGKKRSKQLQKSKRGLGSLQRLLLIGKRSPGICTELRFSLPRTMLCSWRNIFRPIDDESLPHSRCKTRFPIKKGDGKIQRREKLKKRDTIIRSSRWKRETRMSPHLEQKVWQVQRNYTISYGSQSDESNSMNVWMFCNREKYSIHYTHRFVGLDPQWDVRNQLLEKQRSKNRDFYANSITLEKESDISAFVSWLHLFLAICLSSRQPFPAKTLW